MDGNSFYDVIGSNGLVKVNYVYKIVSGFFIINEIVYLVVFVWIFRIFLGVVVMILWLNIIFLVLLV